MTITGSGILHFYYDSVTVTIDNHQAEILEYDQDAEEYIKYDNNELVDLYKKGNRKFWGYNIYQGNLTDAEFETLRLQMEAMNGHVITFRPHYPDGGTGYQCYLEFYFDDCNKFPAKFMNMNIICVDYEDKEAV
jgi:hypothetical protein